MEGRSHPKPSIRDRLRWSVTAIGVCAAFCAEGGRNAASAADYRDGCDTSQTSWEVPPDTTHVRTLMHSRNFQLFHGGEAAEHVRLTSTDQEAVVRLGHGVDRSLVHDDLTASVWFASNRPGATLTMQVRVPDLIDPETRRPVTLEITGNRYTQTGDWEQLSVRSTDLAVGQQSVLLRARMANTTEGDPLENRRLSVEHVTLVVPAKQGETELLIDELQLGPLVRPNDELIFDPHASPRSQRRPSSIRLDPNRLLVENRPFFPRFVSYSGENLDVLGEMGINVALVKRYDDPILAKELAQRDIWMMAEPPVPRPAEEGGLSSAAPVGLMPIPASTERILFWNLGTRIPADQRRSVDRLIDQIRDADRAFDPPRPVIADVVSHEKAFSRRLSMLGSSRHILHTSVTPLQYRDHLQHKKNSALPDRPMFTWIQTGAAAPNMATRHPSRHRPIFVEAEQIWMQAWAAICVGHRGLGFWKSQPLDAETPTAKEVRLAIALLCAHIDLLQPWLATGKVVDVADVRIRVHDHSSRQQQGTGLLPSRRSSRSPEQTIHPEIQAAVIQSDYGRLVIPLWYEEGAQFQPGQMAADDVRFLVRGVEHARAWEVTTTSVQPLELLQPVPGGMEFRLPMIDQFAFVVITNREDLEQQMIQRVRAIERRCAQLWVELARTRLDRVRPMHAHLEQLAHASVPDGRALLRSASELVDQAEVHLKEQHDNDARIHSRYALQLLRRLQRAHWENAVADLTSPVSSPHTVCFETLPDHWQMIAAIGRSTGATDNNLLRSGDFEDYDTVDVDWAEPDRTISPPPNEGEVRGIDLHTDAYEGRYALRLVSRSKEITSPEDVSSAPIVRIASPRIPVQGGQIVIVSGRVRVQELAAGHTDGLMIYDNVKGTVGALRRHNKSPAGQWQPFGVIREVAAGRDFQLYIELNGDGDVRFDNLRVVALNPVLETGGLGTPPDRSRRGLLDFAPSFPKFRLWPGRKSETHDK